MIWSIREVADRDAQALSLVGSATFLETFAGVLDGRAIIEHVGKAHSVAAYRQLLERGGRAWLVETTPGAAPIGFALLTRPDLPGALEDGSDLELKRIYLLSKFHGSGIGANLMEKAISASRETGARRLLLGVYAGNCRARTFYKKLGFLPVASRKFSVGSRAYDDIILALNLQSAENLSAAI